MKLIVLFLFFLANSVHAQIIVYQNQHIVSPYQGPIVHNACGASCWAAKKYGPKYRDLSEVPPEVRARIDNPPVMIMLVQQPVVIPTAPISQPLPGQSREDHLRMQQMSQ